MDRAEFLAQAARQLASAAEHIEGAVETIGNVIDALEVEGETRSEPAPHPSVGIGASGRDDIAQRTVDAARQIAGGPTMREALGARPPSTGCIFLEHDARYYVPHFGLTQEELDEHVAMARRHLTIARLGCEGPNSYYQHVVRAIDEVERIRPLQGI